MPVYNHPITVRLAPTNYSPTSGSVSWNQFTDSLFNTLEHGSVDGIFPRKMIQVIPNNLSDIKNLCDDPTNPDVLGSQTLEINSSLNQGGAYIDDPRAVITQTIDATVGARNTFDLKGHAGCFVDYARQNGATAFNLFIHGQCDRDVDPNPRFESSTIFAPQQGIDNAEVFDNQDPTVSSYVTFRSSESAPGASITSNLFSFRKSIHHGIVRLTRNDMAGISMASGAGGKVYITSFGAFNWGNIQGLSAEGQCTINNYNSPSGQSVAETAQANSFSSTPSTISCARWNGIFEGIFGNTARFRNSGASSLFSSTTPPPSGYQHNGKVVASDPNYDTANLDPYSLSSLPASSNLSIRPIYADTYGNKNYLALGPRISTTPRLSSLGVVAGSYIRITGSSSNNGIYQVLSVLDGIPGDTNENIRVGGGPAYEYIELSRAITVEAPSGTKFITVQNVSNLPVLHIKYREPITT